MLTSRFKGHGKEGVSNAYGAALWGIDYSLYNAALNTSRIHFHQGAIFRYSSWQPDVNATFHRNVLPLYYSHLFTARAFAGGNKQVITILNETYVAAYAIYSQSKGTVYGKARSKLSHVAVINKNAYNASSTTTRPQLGFKLPVQLARASVRRLTAPGVYSKTGLTFAGQTVDLSGTIVNEERVERPENSEVLVADSEAVLISV